MAEKNKSKRTRKDEKAHFFYSFGLMSAIDHCVKGEIWYPLWSSPVLISIEQKRNWSVVFKENKKELILFIGIILALLLSGAW